MLETIVPTSHDSDYDEQYVGWMFTGKIPCIIIPGFTSFLDLPLLQTILECKENSQIALV